MNTGQYVLSFNGEIYNYKNLRKDTEDKWAYLTESDTEVIIGLYHKYGIKGWEKLQGMFAFIFRDKDKEITYFLRDPVGIKPLYYCYYDSKMIVGSKISTILVLHSAKLDYRGVNDILALGYPRTPIYQNVREFEPGYLYDNRMNKKKIDFEIDKKKTIKDAIEEMFITTDRPIGITLSGGVDSSTIALICSKVSKKPLETFTIGFSKNDDDVINARKVAKLIKSNHHEIIVSEKVYEENLKEGIEKLESPFDLGSVAVTNLLAKEISKTNVKVILIGEGADEVFAGYRRYGEKSGLRTAELWEWYKTRITKNNFEDRKKILGSDNVCSVNIENSYIGNNANCILWQDFKNELLYYHLKRIDHIVSDHGIEARVPYLDFSIVMNAFDKSFSSKINSRNNKLLLRDFALAEGVPEEIAFRSKHAFKRKDFDASKHLVKLWEDWRKKNNI